MIEGILGLIFFAIILTICCASADSPSDNTAPKRNTTTRSNTYTRRNVSSSYRECPSCGAPYYDGYCDECGYPDVNQGGLGEEYG